MSASSLFYLVDVSKLDGLKRSAEITVKKAFFSKNVVDIYYDFLENNAEGLEGFNGSGYVYGNLLVFLQEEKNINLLENKYDITAKYLVDKRRSSHFLFSHEQRVAFLSQINPDYFSLRELQKFNQDFSGDYDEETARMSLSAIKILHSNLAKVENENKVLLLIVG
ncbi:hypothetical protein CDA63_02085 [Hymenobacter amundsenii]|uniref:Uncharacterized protein n=1 Tax=Hymenobacter amundsenii TaxID=2006685 RepID=A0A246FQW9_9BACT|nr:hypothetical protein [Hymenobacter amundsenii]OWP65166.1 hypothetical protein CDA63_02085 [Hymenobacter amundsenii]